jgi:hypothetical protein
MPRTHELFYGVGCTSIATITAGALIGALAVILDYVRLGDTVNVNFSRLLDGVQVGALFSLGWIPSVVIFFVFCRRSNQLFKYIGFILSYCLLAIITSGNLIYCLLGTGAEGCELALILALVMFFTGATSLGLSYAVARMRLDS